MQLANKIEAIIFFKAEPVSIQKLSEILQVPQEVIINEIEKLKIDYDKRGLVLVQNEDSYTFGTNKELSDLIENIQKEELNKSLSKASLETLSVILYKNGASRAEIDYIRGINSGFTLRALSIRGLIEKKPDPLDARKYVYKPTFDLLSFLGLTDIQALPQYGEIEKKLISLQSTMNKEEAKNE